MENVLFINACVRPDSRTRILAQEVLDCLGQPYTEVDLNREQYPAMDRQALELREDLRRTELRIHPRFAPAWQFARADIIVVAAPFWDLTFPAALRTYIEYISANGLTYHYEADGCHGDCRAEKLAYLTSGGDLEQPESLGVLYWKQLCAMFGIPAFSYVFAGGLDLDPAKTEEILTEACEKARRLAEDF